MAKSSRSSSAAKPPSSSASGWDSLTPAAAKRRAEGKAVRTRLPLAAQGEWDPKQRTIDPIQVLLDQDKDRVQGLVPVRHSRMAASAFAFYRGSAAVMAGDLATTADTGLSVQANGDAHLSNYGLFATPERRLVFDLNDFDETLTGPWEWDLKRLATSFVLAARDRGFDKSVGGNLAETAAGAYRQFLAGFARESALGVWYASAPVDAVRAQAPNKADQEALDAVIASAQQKTGEAAVEKLTEVVDGQRRFRTDIKRLVVPLRELEKWIGPEVVRGEIEENLRGFTSSVEPARRHLLSRYLIRDIALKVVGVGSVGTRCFAVLAEGIDHAEPLMLQVKQAMPSALALAGLPSDHTDQGRRVVEGQRLIQSASDIFLGYSSYDNEQFYYWRQLADEKGSVDLTVLKPGQFEAYARLCGWALAHAHARGGDAVAISGYIGKHSDLDQAIRRFALAYADQADSDFQAWKQGIKDGRIASSESMGT